MEISITAAEKSLEIARGQLEFGSINGYDFRQTQLSLLNVRRMYTELNFSLKSQEIDILRLTGVLTGNIIQ
jgi:outer membrane protein TolC